MLNHNNEIKFISKYEVNSMLNAQTNTEIGNIETIKYSVNKYTEGDKVTFNNSIIEDLRLHKLFDFEIYQLIDNWPKSLLCLQLIIEEMEERYGIDELNNILNIFTVNHSSE